MERKSVERFVRTVERDVKFVDEAISHGAYLSFEEWHDFVFKASVADFHSGSLAKYETVRPNVTRLARLEAYILECISDAQLRGFTGRKAVRTVQSVVRRFNKILGVMERIKFSRTDVDGVVTYIIDACDFANQLKREITNRDSLCYFLQDLWVFGVQELRMFNKDTFRFLEDHLNTQITALIEGKRPTPYFGCVKSNTLEAVLRSRTEYETAKRASTSVEKKNTHLLLKVANGSNLEAKQ